MTNLRRLETLPTLRDRRHILWDIFVLGFPADTFGTLDHFRLDCQYGSEVLMLNKELLFRASSDTRRNVLWDILPMPGYVW